MARITQQSGCGWEVKSLKKRWADYRLYWQWMGMCFFLFFYLAKLYLQQSNRKQ